MVAALVDSSILIDASRKYAPAVIWIAAQTDLGVTSITRLELIEGAQSKNSQQTILTLLRKFKTVENNTQDFYWAEANLVRFQLSHSVGLMDCLIAAASHRLQIPLYTQNLKHFTPLLRNLAQKPY